MFKAVKTISLALILGLFLIYAAVFSISPALAASCYDGSENNSGGLISGVNAVVSSNSQATVSWTTDQNADSYVRYSNNMIGHSLFLASPPVSDSTLTKNHSVVLNALTSGNTYYYEVHSTNASGTTSINCNGGNFWTFTMPSTNITPPVYPAAGGAAAGGSTGGSAGGAGTATTPPPPASSLDITLPTDVNNPINSTAGSIVLTIFKYAMGFIGIAALGAIIYGAILRITSAGNPSKITEGNAYIIGAISGIALLAGSALILNTINPNLTQIGKTEQSLSAIKELPTSTASNTFNMSDLFASSETAKNAPIVEQAAWNAVMGDFNSFGSDYSDPQSSAAHLLGRSCSVVGICTNSPLATLYGPDTADCQANSAVPALSSDPYSILIAQAAGGPIMVCSSGCNRSHGCSSQSISVYPAILNAIAAISSNLDHLKVTSLTGGSHVSNSRHYTGEAADVVPDGTLAGSSSESNSWFAIVTMLHDMGFNAYCEVGADSSTLSYTSAGCTTAFDSNGSPKVGAHIHFQD